jgi:4-nitrophenyl phosphatase/NagD protein
MLAEVKFPKGQTLPIRSASINMNKLALVKCFLLDMDGTIFIGDRLLPGAAEFLRYLDEHDVEHLFLTNNSSKHSGQYAQKLHGFGLNVSEGQIFTSGEAAALYIQGLEPSARIYLVGTSALQHEFSERGFALVEDEPNFAVLGFDTTLTYDKLWKLCNFVRAGVRYIATHPDYNCPVEGGFMPDIGATIAFVAASTGRKPDVVIGKPNVPIVEMSVEKSGVPLESLCMVGDRLYTDIALGESGITTVLVLTGETKPDDIPASPHQPDYVVQNLVELLDILRTP